MVDIKEQVPLAPYTTFHIGGDAQYFVEVNTQEELREAVAWARAQDVPLTILGGGSNVLISDEGVRGLVIHNRITGMTADTNGTQVVLTVGAGEIFDEVIAHTVAQGWWGLENLSCIPGSVGATPVQNVGAYGVEIKDRVAQITAYDVEDDAVVELQPHECEFAYRDSLFKHVAGKRYVITHVAYALSTVPTPMLHYRDLRVWQETHGNEMTLADIRDAVCVIRSRKFPDWNVLGTAGSFFKNPTIAKEEYEALRTRYPELPGHETETGDIKIPLGWVLDTILKVRGYREGKVGTYEGQALVLVNYGGATAAEVHAFASMLAENIFDATNICVEWEVTDVQ